MNDNVAYRLADVVRDVRSAGREQAVSTRRRFGSDAQRGAALKRRAVGERRRSNSDAVDISTISLP
jgi:hypothetical protein